MLFLCAICKKIFSKRTDNLIMNPSREKLAQIRGSMKEGGIDLYISPVSDPHHGEYIPDHWRIISWLTGFTGSAATVVITESFAGLWTDSRYFIQADEQLKGSGFVLMKSVRPDNKNFTECLCENIKPGSRIALDGRTFSIERMRKIEQILKREKVSFDIDCDLISEIWTDRPPMPFSVAFDHSVIFYGKERAVKIAEVREQMAEKGVDYHLLTSIDDIMWLLNIRGNDVKYSPLLTSFAIVDEDQILLFADERQIPLKLASEFDKLDIVILPYEETAGMLSALPADSTILLTPGTTSTGLFNSIPKGMNIKEDISIPTCLKAIKNKVEIENICRVMVRDGVALTKFYFWLHQNLGSEVMSELSLAEKLDGIRSENENFLGPSFSTIVAWNEHGALPHYSATPESDSVIGTDGILLVDSGGQYLNGTTDITRTIAIGRPTA